MDVAAYFMMGIWVDTVDMATVGVGIGLMGADIVGVVGKSWAITLTLYLLFCRYSGSPLLFSHFGSWVFSG